MLGERICLLRKRLRLSRSDLAAQLGVSLSAVGMYEQGRREPSLGVTVELGRILGVSTDYLLTGKPLTERDCEAMHQAMAQTLAAAPKRRGSFSEEELTVLLTAMMTHT